MADASAGLHLNPFMKRSKERIVSPPGSLNGEDISLDALSDCEVFILDHTAAIYVDECTNCQIRIGPVASFCFFRGCSGCQVSVACQQFRAKECHDLVVYLYSASDPHLELCSNILIGPYNFAYPQQDVHFAKAKLNPSVNKWSVVYDHNASSSSEDPHWSLMDPSAFVRVKYEIKGDTAPVDPVPKPRMFTVNQKPSQIVGSHIGEEMPAEKQSSDEKLPEKTRKDVAAEPPAILMEDSAEENEEEPVPRSSYIEAPALNVWGAPNLQSEASKEDSSPEASVLPVQSRATSTRRSAKLPQAEFLVSDNRQLTMSSPRSQSTATEEIRIFYTKRFEYIHPVVLAGNTVPAAVLQKTLRSVSDEAVDHHNLIRVYSISAFCLLLTALLLLLMVVLIEDFVGLYEEGLAVQLGLLGLIFVFVLGFIVAKVRAAVKRGNAAVQSTLEHETAAKFRQLGVQLTGDLFSLRIISSSKDSDH